MPMTCTLTGAGDSIITAEPAGEAAPAWPAWALTKAPGEKSGSPMSRCIELPCSPT